MEGTGNDKQNESDECDVNGDNRKRDDDDSTGQEDVERKMKAEDKRESLENMNLKNEMKTLKKTLSADEEDEGSKGSVDEEERKETRTGAREKKEQELSSSDSTSTSTTDDESETSSEDKTEPLTMDMDKIKWLIQILEMTVSRRSRSTRDQTACESAQVCLQQMAETKLHEFVLQYLSAVLVAVDVNLVDRKAAGLQLKNQLISEDPDMKFQYQQRWLTIPVETRGYIKNNILGALGTENNRPSFAAQCVAYVAVAELAVEQWSELIPLLVGNVESSSNEMMKKATLETIGYIWQEITYDIYSTSQHVRLAALRALYNSMELFKGNFEIETERNFIMGVVCEATQSTNTQIRVTALQCLVKIMSLYYLYMDPYMSPALFPIAIEAMKSDIDEVALQGIEFCLNVFEPLVFISPEGGRPPLEVYVKPLPCKGDLQYLIRVLMKKLNINIRDIRVLMKKLNITMNHSFNTFAPRRHRSQELFEDDGSLSNVRPIRNIDREYRNKALRIISEFRCDMAYRRHNADNLTNDSYFS